MILKIADALPAYREYSMARGLSPGTIDKQQVTLRQFHRACQEVKGPLPTLGQVDHSCVTRMFATLGGAQGNRNNAVQRVKDFLRWAEKLGYLRPGITAAVLMDGYRTKLAERQPKYYFSAAEFPALLEAAGESGPVDRVIIALALYTLARASEISPIRLRDLDLVKREVRLYRDKTDRYTDVPLTPELAGELNQWLITYAEATGYFSPHTMMREHPDWLLCPSKRTWHGGFVLQPDRQIVNMERLAKRVMTAMGVTGTRRTDATDHLGEGMHTFRRSGARAFLKHLSESRGHQRALLWVSLMLDHKALQTTLAYVGVDQEKDELNDWLRGNEMYSVPEPPPAGSVIPFRRVV